MVVAYPCTSSATYNDRHLVGDAIADANKEGGNEGRPTPKKSTTTFSVENEVRHYRQSPEEFTDNPWSGTDTSPIAARLHNFLCVYTLSFTYGVTTHATYLLF